MPEEVKLTSQNDIKIFILFLLDSVGCPMTYDEINEITLHDGFVDFIDFAESFGELVSAGHIIETKDGETAYYTVSPTGKTVAGSLQDQILQPIRERAFRSALRILSFKKRNAEISCTLKEKDGGYLVECSIRENGITLMSASVLCDSRIRAERMKENFIERPEAIYKGLSALLASEVNYLFT
ncbi:MAG: DUF4364 family protein [Eubacteriales bacterium]|nr:DUF4364 family protein [Eubacteriales bacterium]